MSFSVKQINLTDNAEALSAIFTECFPEDADFADVFLRHAPKTVTCFAGYELDIPVCALYLLPADLQIGDTVLKAQYVYGVGTLAAYRGKGYAKRLLEVVQTQTTADVCILYPANASLRGFYKNCGYQDAFITQRVIAKQSDVSALSFQKACPFCASTYAAMRAEFLKRHPFAHAVFSQEILELLLSHAQVACFDGGTALVVQQKDKVFVPEVLCDGADLPRMLTALSTVFSEQTVYVNLPLAGEDSLMVLPLREIARELLSGKEIPFFGTVFDV